MAPRSINSIIPSQPARQQIIARRSRLAAALLTPPEIPSQGHCADGWDKFTGCVRANFDRFTYLTMPRLAGPSLLFGTLFALTGFALFVTSCVGVQMEFLQRILKNVPLSFMLSFVLMRLGLHLIDTGIRYSNSKKRIRQEVLREYRTLSIKNTLGLLKEGELAAGAAEIRRMNAKLEDKFKILPKEQVADVLAYIDQQDSDDFEVHGEFVRKFYGKCTKILPAVGKADIILSLAMFAVGLIAFSFLCKPSRVPKVFEIVTKDPYLSISFVFIFFASAITSLKIGLQLNNYDRREEKREALRRDLKLIDKKVRGDVIEEVERPEIRMRELCCCVKLAKTMKPYLPILSILVGTILLTLGCIYMALAVNQKLPPFLDFLASNSKSNIPFATGIILGGIHAIYRGISISQKKMKENWKVVSKKIRDDFIKPPAVPAEGQVYNLNMKALQDALHNEKAEKYHLLVKALKMLWIPDLLSGGLMLACCISVLCVLAGWTKTPKALTNAETKFSLTFAASLLVLAVDAFNMSWRCQTFNKRMKDDKTLIETLYKGFAIHYRRPPDLSDLRQRA